MKKLVSLILALALVMSLATVAFADAETVTSVPGTKESIPVKAKYVEAETTPTVYSVDITWGALQFTCTHSGNHDWNPADHSYTDNTVTEWTGDGNTVKVTNHSNAKVNTTFAFAALEAYNGITGSFDKTGAQELAAGVEGGYENAANVTATLTLEGELASEVTDFTQVGTVTVTLN